MLTITSNVESLGDMPNNEVCWFYPFQEIRSLDDLQEWFTDISLISNYFIESIHLYDPTTYFETGDPDLKLLGDVELNKARTSLIDELEKAGATSISVLGTYCGADVVVTIDIGETFAFSVWAMKADEDLIGPFADMIARRESKEVALQA